MTELTATFDLQQIVGELAEVRQRWRTQQQRSTEPGGRELPSREELTRIVEGLRGALFPMRLGPPDLRQESEDFYVGHTLDTVLHALLHQVRLELHYSQRNGDKQTPEVLDAQAIRIVREFGHALPQIRSLLDSDVMAAFEGDPAARSVDEVLLAYPGIEAMIHHRVAHRLYALGVPLLARLVAELAQHHADHHLVHLVVLGHQDAQAALVCRARHCRVVEATSSRRDNRGRHGGRNRSGLVRKVGERNRTAEASQCACCKGRGIVEGTRIPVIDTNR